MARVYLDLYVNFLLSGNELNQQLNMDFNSTMYILMHYINAQKLYTLKALYIERQGRGPYKLMLASMELSWLLIPRTL